MSAHDLHTSTVLYCIFGRPVGHTVSPVMQNAAFRETGIDAVYLAFEPASIEGAMRAMREIGIRGASVTIPFKIEALRHADAVDPLAEAIGSVNTIVNTEGRLTGYNTDGTGALRALEEARVRIEGSTCLVIGNGGSARAIAATLAERGARIIITGRNGERISALAAAIHGPVQARALQLDALGPGLMETIDIIINTTPVGMAPDTGATPLPDSLLAPRHTVFDIVYAPHVTRLLAAAQARGCVVVHGIEMLIHQGARQFELWTGRPAPVGVMRRAIFSHLGITDNARKA
jgi:shikimate dehydrogenase